MIVCLANKTQFRDDILSKRIEEIVHESLKSENKLNGTLRKSRISNLFVGSGAFTATPSNTFQGPIVDEAHRPNEKSGLSSNLGENQIKELIDASSFTVFLPFQSFIRKLRCQNNIAAPRAHTRSLYSDLAA